MESLYHLLFIGSFFVPIALLIYLMFQNRKMTTIKRNYSFWSILQMALQYVIAYNFVFFIQELFLAWGKNWIGLTSYLYHNNHGWDGIDSRTALLQGSGALAILFFGLLMIGVFLIMRKRNISVWTKTMVLWLAFQGLIQSLPQVTTAFVAKNTDVGQAFNYLSINGIKGFSIALLSVIAIVYFTYWTFNQIARLGLLEMANSKSQFNSALKIIVLPAIIASILIIPYHIFPWDRGFNQFFSLIPWLPWFAIFAALQPKEKISIMLRSKGILATVLVAIFILLVFQLVLAPGVIFNP